MMMFFARSRDQYLIDDQENAVYTSQCPPWEHYLAQFKKKAIPWIHSSGTSGTLSAHKFT